MVFCLQSLQSFASLCIWQKFKHMDIIFQTSTLELLSYKVDFCPNSLIELDKIIDLTLKTYSDDPVVEKMYSNSRVTVAKTLFVPKSNQFGVFFH